MHLSGLVELEPLVVDDAISDDVGHHVGAAARAVDGEEAHPCERQAKHVVVGVAHHLSGDLGGRVGGQRLTQRVVFPKRESLGAAIDGGGGGKDKVEDARLAGRLQQVDRAAHVDVHVERPALDGVANPCHRRQMGYGVEPASCADAFHCLGVPNVGLV